MNNSNITTTIIPFGQPIGKTSNNILAFSSDNDTNQHYQHYQHYSYLKIRKSNDSLDERTHDKLTENLQKIFCGIKFQCVEYVRRWLILTYGITFQQIDMAYMLFTEENICFRNIWTNQLISYNKILNGSNHSNRSNHSNGSDILPRTGSILLWDKTKQFLTGHVAIILYIDEDYVYIGEQNWSDTLWTNPYSRKIPIIKTSNYIWLDDTNQYGLKILGWLNLKLS